MGPVVGPGVLQLEPLRQVEIELNGRALPDPPDRVLELDVDLGPVERASALVDAVRDALAVERLGAVVAPVVPGSIARLDAYLAEGRAAGRLSPPSPIFPRLELIAAEEAEA